MGDGADFALERAEAEYEHFERYRDAPMHIQYDEGIIDERGQIIGDPFSYPGPTGFVNRASGIKPTGPGGCPVCGAETTLRDGRFGNFYGCPNFPKCKGSRNI